MLGKGADAAEYAALLGRIKAAFQKEYVSASGRVGENTQTAYALALRFDFLPEDLRAEAARRLAEDVRSRGHLTTGSVGTPHVVAGIDLDPATPGYKHVRIQPQPGGGLTWVDARLETLYGPVASAWRIANDTFELSVEAPPNTRATVRLPQAPLASVAEGGGAPSGRAGVSAVRRSATRSWWRSARAATCSPTPPGA